MRIGRSLFGAGASLRGRAAPSVQARPARVGGAGALPPGRSMPSGGMQLQAQQAQQAQQGRMSPPSAPVSGPQPSIGMPVGKPVGFKKGGMVNADMVSPRKAMAMGMKAGGKKPAKKGSK